MSESPPFKGTTILAHDSTKKKKTRSNPTHAVSESHQFESNRLALHRLAGTLTLPRDDSVREHDRGEGRILTSNGVRRGPQSGVDPPPAVTNVAVMQLSHADDEPRHYGAYGDIRQKVQDEQHGIVRRQAVVEQRQIDVVQCMPSDSCGQFSCEHSRVE